MIPIRDENPTAHTAFATISFIALNCYAWVTAQGLGAEIPLVTSVCELGLIPAELTGAVPPDTPLRLGEHHCISGGNSLANVFSSMFMHGGWGHILGNLWFLWIFGDNVEDAMGPVRFTIFYLMCGVAAALAQVASNPQSAVPMVGASGAIGGVMGAYIRLYPRAHIHMFLFFGFFVGLTDEKIGTGAPVAAAMAACARFHASDLSAAGLAAISAAFRLALSSSSFRAFFSLSFL